MNFDNELYKQLKAKSKTNHQLFLEKSDIPVRKIVKTNQIFSSITFEDQAEAESFSLRLSESYIDETQESSESKFKQNQLNETVIISDSSSNDSIFSNKSNKLIHRSNIKAQIQKGVNILESSEDESYSTSVQHAIFKTIPNIDPISKTQSEKNNIKKILIEKSFSKTELNGVPQIIKESVVKGITLSDKKKNEIIQWLTTNMDGSRYGSSYSQESIISNSRKSGISSGNSSLERLELNFETPNNRGKILKSMDNIKYEKTVHKESTKQTTLDQYFIKSKTNQLNIEKDKLFRCINSDKTPINIKPNSKKLLMTELKLNSDTPRSKSSDKKTPISIIKINSKKIPVSESESFDSKTSESTYFDKTPGSNNNINSKRIIIPESESFDSKTPESDNSDWIPESNKKNNSKITPKSNFLESNDDFNTSLMTIPKSVNLKDNDNTELLKSFTDLKLKHKTNKKNFLTNDTTTNSTINDCADILENLYGKIWRDKASALVSATEPKKRSKQFFTNKQTEKNITFRQPRYNWKSDSDLSDKENFCKSPLKFNKTLKKSKNINRSKDSFINDDSTTESSLDCSYYTALTNPISSQNNQLKILTPSTEKINDKNKTKKILKICDSESDVDERNYKNKNSRRNLSFSSSNSSTSEFDPEDIVLPRPTSKNSKIQKFTKFDYITPKVNKHLEEQDNKRSFLASLSNNVPLENSNFKAMVYRVKYNVMKEELCKVLFKLFNEHVFDNQLPDDMLIEWSTRLRGTAGKCYNKQSLKTFNNTVRSSRIVLATKILDCPDRLRDTLIHEMCHAATWLINNVSDGHGNFWKAWANKAKKVFPELPPISRCHNYEIETKYTYKCTSCGYNFGRHSKSLDLNKKRCGYCHGRFELLINKVTKNGKVQKKSSAQTKEPSKFALYVKNNYQLVKKNGIAVKHGEIMKILGKQFSAIKITPKPDDCIRSNENES